MRDNINKVADRGTRLDHLQNKTDDLAASAQGFRRGANKVRKQMWWKVSSHRSRGHGQHADIKTGYEDAHLARRRHRHPDHYHRCSSGYVTFALPFWVHILTLKPQSSQRANK